MGLFDKFRGMFGGGASDDDGHGHAHRHPAVGLRPNTAEFHEFVVRSTLESERGPEQLGHGLCHVAELLALDPRRAEWLEWVETFDELHPGDLLALLPEGGERYFAHEALRAYVLGRRGAHEDAVALLTAVAGAKPDVEYLEAWALAWVEPAGAFEALDPETALRLLSAVLARCPEYAGLTAEREPDLKRYALLSMRLPKTFAQPELAPMADMVVGGLLRRAGLFDEGLAWVRGLAEARGWSWGLATAEGLLLRQRGSLDEADRAFAKAGELDPDDVSSMLEAGDMHFNLERWGPALAWYAKALAKQPGHPWADASTLWCQWRELSRAVFPDEQFPDRLVELAQAGNPRATMLLSQFRPYVGFVPEPQDATANSLRSLLDHHRASPAAEPGFDLAMTTSQVEAPSNLVALKLALGPLDPHLTISVNYSHVATPDPREPVEPIEHTLWQRDGEVLVPGVVPPRAPVAEAVSRLAQAPFDADRWWASASRLGARLGPDGVEDLLACIPHPPPPAEGVEVLSWIPRVHLVAAFALAHVDAGWAGSARRSALHALLLGPPDWSTESAIVALTHLAYDHEVYSPDISALFERLAEGRPDVGPVSHEYALYTQWITLPHLFDEEREALADVIEALEAADEDSGAG